MGNEIVSFYKNNVKKEWKIAFWSAFIGFLLIHLYKVTNYLPNHDTLYNFYSTQDMTGSGRWFLQYACGISSYFDLPWINGLLCAVYLGITTAAITQLLDIKNPVVIVLTGLLLAGTPSTTETLFFGYTADGYLLGLAMSALAAYLSCQRAHIGRYVLSGLLLCLSCGIYQSCVSFAIVLCICYLVLKLLNGEITAKESWKWIGKHVIIYAAAMATYYLVWKMIMLLKGISATGYQGIDSVGQISLSTLLGACVQSVSNVALFFLEWNILEHPISTYGVLNVVFLFCFAAVIVVAIAKSNTHRSASRLAMVLFCLAATIPMLSVWSFLSPGVAYRPMMLHGISLYYVLALILFDQWIPSRTSTSFAVLIAVIVFNYAVMANCAYFWLNKCYEKTYYRGSQIMNTVVDFQLENDHIEKVAFVGKRVEEVYSDDSLFTKKVHLLSMCLEEDLLYDHIHTYLFLENTFGLDIPRVLDAHLKELEAMSQVQNMPVWPAAGSLQMIDDTLVIKIGE